MGNFKVKVNNEAESKEAQELFFELGYGWHAHGKKVSYLNAVTNNEFSYLVAWSTGCFTDVIQCGCGSEDAKEITLPELRAMVKPSLNDQYAEIEQVRQAEIHGTVKAKSAWDTQIGGIHYKQFKIQPMQFALENKLDAAQQNVIKYIMRHSFKNGKQDLEKAKHYIDLMIEFYYGDLNHIDS